MKTEKNIGIAFILNAVFSLFELVGGILIGSTAILSDAIHDAGDAVSIGMSYFLEKKSKKQPDDIFTYGYTRYSVLGGLLTTLTLLLGSAIMIYNAVLRIFSPTQIDYNGMILFAVVGVVVNLCAAYATHNAESLNQKAVNLHMFEDVLGWIVVLIGAIVMRFTNFALLDPLLSIAVSLYILLHAIRNLKKILDLFLQKSPINTSQLKDHLSAIDGVSDVHHIHLWSLDDHTHCATLHVVTDHPPYAIKTAVRETLKEHGIAHATIETETSQDPCHDTPCRTEHHH
ncbi:MAG: cation transporter [Clostridia bacterium]|nr:cation transporter [Clostridia bacterium]